MPVQPSAVRPWFVQFSYGWGVVVAGLVSDGISGVDELFLIALSIRADELASSMRVGWKLD